MTETNRLLTVAFVRQVADLCTTCYRRGPACGDCFASRARRILSDIERDERSRPVDYSLAFRMARIERQLLDYGRPVPSSRIDTRDICSKQLKRWTLGKLVELGRVSRTTDGKTGCYLYSSCKKETKNENHAAGNQQLQAHQGASARSKRERPHDDRRK